MKHASRMVAFSVIAVASTTGVALASYPTVWIVENASDVPASARCIGASSAQLGPLQFDSPRIAPTLTTAVTWPQYSDGMGLEGAHWTCGAGGVDGVFTGPRLQFDTEWGEPVSLRIVRQGGSLIVQRAPVRR